jgi:hypothetical protein
LTARALPELECRYFDGPLTEAPWQRADAAQFVETVGGGPPDLATSVQVLWSSVALLVRFSVTDPDPWATLTEHDAPLWEEEVVELFIDPEATLDAFFEVEVNMLNAWFDAVFRANRSGFVGDSRWHCDGRESNVTRTEAGWEATLALPFAAFGAAVPRCGTVWRMNFCRIDRPQGRPRELSSWSPCFRPRFATPERFGRIRFASSAPSRYSAPHA